MVAIAEPIAAVKERPILFSGAMVRAILNGQKVQTRRVIKEAKADWELGTPEEWMAPTGNRPAIGGYPKNMPLFRRMRSDGSTSMIRIPCPYGKIGDLLYVRETFALESWTEFPDQVPTDGRPILRKDCGDYERITVARYRATEEADLACEHERCIGGPCDRPWKPSIHMPRWASRITLEITDVRAQRLQEISEEDARAEGCSETSVTDQTVADLAISDEAPIIKALGAALGAGSFTAKLDYMMLWDSINSKRGYSSYDNPWVWAISFRVVSGNALRRAE